MPIAVVVPVGIVGLLIPPIRVSLPPVTKSRFLIEDVVILGIGGHGLEGMMMPLSVSQKLLIQSPWRACETVS